MALSPPKQRNSQSGHEQLRADDTLFVELKDEIWRDQDVVGLTLIELRHALRKLISISSIHNNHLDSQSRRKPLQLELGYPGRCGCSDVVSIVVAYWRTMEISPTSGCASTAPLASGMIVTGGSSSSAPFARSFLASLVISKL